MPMIPMAPTGAPPGPGDPAGGAAALMSLLSQGGAPGGAPAGPPPPDQANPLDALQNVIQDLHTLIAILPDEQATATASQCLASLTRIQSQMMGAQNQAGTANQALMQQMGGGGGGKGAGGGY